MASKRPNARGGKIHAQPGRKSAPALPAQEVKQPVSSLPASYAAFLEDLKARIRAAQVKAALSVNRELIALYWHVGKSIVERQRMEGWGKSVVERLACDLQAEFPGVEGFSQSNISRMRAFYLAWTDEVRNSAQPAPEMDGENLPQAVGEIPMNFYLSAVDDLLRHPDDKPSIGLILCKDRNKVVVEYALRDTRKPVGVAAYRLTASLPKHLKGSLPSIEQLEAELKADKNKSRSRRQ